ncbi:MAG TPA: OsmC family protein [Bryobacteraceae bacterium]|nr:OsmC family protein [Bryobacteraceae bacterium]HOQ44552.1 OsmC family protein [Bryobacteraceae bacterium]HPQ16282.1 OsmC family protein [Bryobacteraceae bacterium]HPU70871.1 OsmC family protein [Bryobacteraceae bacterium]
MAETVSETVKEFAISIDQVRDYEFRVRFDKEHIPELTVDEPPPLGKDAGPSPSRLLAAAIGSCLSASLLFCARKAKAEFSGLHTGVKVTIVRNERKRLRVGGVEVTIEPQLADEDREKAARCLELFEDFCTVTESIRAGIPVKVNVKGLDSGKRAEAAPST